MGSHRRWIARKPAGAWTWSIPVDRVGAECTYPFRRVTVQNRAVDVRSLQAV